MNWNDTMIDIFKEFDAMKWDADADYIDRFISWFEYLTETGVDREDAFLAALHLAGGNYEY